MALFENYDRRIDKINGVLAQYGLESVEQFREICKEKGFDPYEIAQSIQPICFENVKWAYCVGAAIAIKQGAKSAAEAAKLIGSVFRASALTALSLKTARSVSDTATSAQCSSATRHSASHSSQATSHSRLQKAQSAL